MQTLPKTLSVHSFLKTAKEHIRNGVSPLEMVTKVASQYGVEKQDALALIEQSGIIHKKSVEKVRSSLRKLAQQTLSEAPKRKGKGQKQTDLAPNHKQPWSSGDLLSLQALCKEAESEGKTFLEALPLLSVHLGRKESSVERKAGEMKICVKSVRDPQPRWHWNFVGKKPKTAVPDAGGKSAPSAIPWRGKKSGAACEEPDLDVLDVTIPVTGDVTAFRGFDFTVPLSGPIAEAFQQCFIDKCLTKPIKEGAFLCVDFPTGSGKTHGVAQHILAQMLRDIKDELAAREAGEKYDVSKRIKIVFIVNTVDNVREGYKLLKGLIEGDKFFYMGFKGFTPAQKQCLLSRMIYVPGKDNTLVDIDTDTMESLLELLRIPKKDPIRHEVFTMEHFRKVLEQATREDERTSAKSAISNAAGSAFSKMLSHLRNNMFYGGNKNKELKAFVKSNMALLQHLVPGVRLETGAAQVAFMTTKKFLYGVHYSQSMHSMINDAGNCWLIIDEFDRQNTEIVDYLLETQAIPLVETFKQISSLLQKNQYAEIPANEGCGKPLAEITKMFDEASSRWSLQYALHQPEDHRPEGNGARLFIDHRGSNLITSLDRDEAYVYERDPEHRVNRYRVVEGVHDVKIPEDNNFVSFVRELEHLTTVMFPRKFLEAAKIKLRNSNPGGQEDETQIRLALDDILNHFGLSHVADIIHRYRGYTSFGSLANKMRSSDSSFHTYGMRVVTVDGKEGSKEQVDVRSLHVPLSATALLAVMVSNGCKMLGISATAYAPTVLHNFDMRYLQATTGASFYTLGEHHRQAVAREYASEQNYDAAGVKLRAGEAEPIENFERFIEAWRPELPVSAKYDLIIERSDSQSTRNYYVRLYAQLLGQLKAYFNDPHQRYFFGFSSFLFKNEKGLKLRDFIVHAIGQLAAECGIKPDGYVLNEKVDRDFLKEDFQKKVVGKMKVWGGKMICLTAYQTMSVGKNADYVFDPFIDGRSTVSVSAKKLRQNSVDIDCVYMGPCTNILNVQNSGEKERLRACYYVQCLEEADEISPDQKNYMHKKIMQSTNLRNTISTLTGEILKETNAYHAAVAKTIRQTTGRLGRSGVKRKHITVTADEDVLRSLAKVGDEDMVLANHEYEKLKNYALLKYKKGSDCAGARLLTSLQNHASKKQDHGKRYFEAIVRRFNGGVGKERDLKEWTSVRRDLLQSPTRTDSSAITHMCYLDVGEEATSYRYSGMHDKPTSFFGEYSDKAVSAEAECLETIMRNKKAYAAALREGVATTFAPGRYHMTPWVATSIYRGALGEFAGEAIFSASDYRQKPMPQHQFERFDGILVHPEGKWCHVDYKHLDPEKYESMSDEEREKERATIAYKLDDVQSPGLIIVNMLGDTNLPIRYLNDDLTQNVDVCDARVLVIPWLIDRETGADNHEALLAMELWFQQKALPFDGENVTFSGRVIETQGFNC